MGENLYQRILDVAKRAATDARPAVLAALGSQRADRKPDNSMVTETDHAAQASILESIGREFPDHAVIAEETVRHPDNHADVANARYTWVVDPVDGTRNLVTGFPCVATSIGVLDAGRPVVAVVAEHGLGYVYEAILGRGTKLNGRDVRVVDQPKGTNPLVGGPSSKEPVTCKLLTKLIATKGLIYRNLGSSATHLGMISSGALAAGFAIRCKIWDLAGGHLLITEAGGRVTDLAGDDLLPFDLSADPQRDIPFIAGAPDAHARLLSLVQSL